MGFVRSTALLCVALLCACSREPRYHVSARLLEHLPSSLEQFASGDCAVADEHRPALGCTAWRWRLRTPVAQSGQQPELAFPVPPGERDTPIILKLRWREPKRADVVHRVMFSPLIARPGPRVRVVIPDFPAVAAGSTLLVWSRVVPKAAYRTTTPVTIPKGSVLSVGLGLDAETPAQGVEAVEFTLTAEGKGGSRELLHAVVRPASPEQARWEDHLVPLDALEDQAVTFAFVTRIQPSPGTPPHRAVVVPLWGAPEVLTAARDDEHPNVILISLDTLRGDHVGALGATLPLTPHIDALAEGGVVFENASTTFPSTTGGHLSMLTGLYPIRLGIEDPSRRMPKSSRMLAEALGAAGWRTNAVTEDVMLAIPVGFSRGFARYEENLETEPLEPPSFKVAHTADAAIRLLEENRDERFFLFVHTYAVHFPYAAPEEYHFTTWKDGDVERPFIEAPEKVKLRLRYAADVRYADAQVGRLVDTVKRLGLERRTIVVVTSDHGEAFYEHHERWGHSIMIYDEIMHVPLVMWGPGRLPAGRRVRTPFSLVDLPPTILELAGAPPLADIDGESQVARIHGGPEDLDRVVYAFSPAIAGFHEDQIAARTLSTKWLLTASTPPRLVAYDLTTDPGEQRPLDDPALLARGHELMARYQGLEAKATAPTEVPVSDETRKRLEALGYAD